MHAYVNDIALILLETEIKFQEHADNGFYGIPAGELSEARGTFVRPICLPSPVKEKKIRPTHGFNLVASGYGFTPDGEGEYLKHGNFQLAQRNKAMKLHKSQMAAENLEQNTHYTDTCKGDSGGPLSFEVVEGESDLEYSCCR